MCCSLAALASPVGAWGPTGHAVIGQAAAAQLSAPARVALLELLGLGADDDPAAALAEACSWPDTVRDAPEWAWSAPMHYVNLPRSSGRYDRQRDCPDGICVTEGVLAYAARLSQAAQESTAPGRSNLWQNFAWLCHLVGDLHQPLHVGFRDDRGGNRVEVEYGGERYNLHRFWDSVLVEERWPAEIALPVVTGDEPGESGPEAFDRAALVRWTEESHRLALEAAYPSGAIISAEFADRSWSVIQEQWRKAATRLALALETTLAADP